MTDYSKKEQEPSAEPVDYAKADAWAAEPILQPRHDEEHAEWLPSYVVNAARAYLALRAEVERLRDLIVRATHTQMQDEIHAILVPSKLAKCGCRFAVRYGLRRIDHRAECPFRYGIRRIDHRADVAPKRRKP